MHYQRKEGEALIPETIALDALCVWEAMLEMYRSRHEHYTYLQGQVGAYAMREAALELAPYAEVLWSQSTQDGEIEWTFDWEFVPQFVELVMDMELINYNDNTGTLSFDELDDQWMQVEQWALQKINEKRAA